MNRSRLLFVILIYQRKVSSRGILPIPTINTLYTMPTFAQDRLKRLQSSLRKIDKTEKCPKFSSHGSHSQHKQINTVKSLLHALDDPGPSACVVQRKAHSSKLVNTTASTRLKSLDRSQQNAEVPNPSLPTAAVASNISSIRTTKLAPPTSKKDKIRNNSSELHGSDKEKANSNSSITAITSGTVSTCAIPSTRSRFASTYKKLRITWEKPKALIDAVSQINRKIPAKKILNQANDRLARLRTTLRKSQPVQIFPDDSESMDWQPINDDEQDLPPTNSQTIQQVFQNDNAKEDTNDALCEDYGNAFSESAAEGDWRNVKIGRRHTKTTNISHESESQEIAQSSVEHLNRTVMSNVVSNLHYNNKSNVPLPEWKLDHLYFVIDTNVLLNYRVFVDNLTKKSLCDTAGGVLYIPYVVIRELDNLKDRNSNESIRLKAMQAIRFLNKKFDESKNNIQAQSAQMEKEHRIEIDCPDDSIVNSCLQLKSAVQHMMLLTDDGNLRLKAKACGIAVTTKSDLIAKYPEKFK